MDGHVALTISHQFPEPGIHGCEALPNQSSQSSCRCGIPSLQQILSVDRVMPLTFVNTIQQQPRNDPRLGNFQRSSSDVGSISHWVDAHHPVLNSLYVQELYPLLTGV
jgi:hypothetical protein